MRRSFLHILAVQLLLVVVFASFTTAQSSNGSMAASIVASNSSASQCEICRDSGDCLEAYKGTAGKFCNSWLDTNNNRRACCCPAEALCSSDNTYECTCQKSNARLSNLIWIGLGVFAIGALIGGGVLMAMRKRRMQQKHGDYPAEAGGMGGAVAMGVAVLGGLFIGDILGDAGGGGGGGDEFAGDF